MGHPLISENQCHRTATLRQLAQGVDGLLTTACSDDAVVVDIAGPKVALYGTEYLWLVVDGEDYGRAVGHFAR